MLHEYHKDRFWALLFLQFTHCLLMTSLESMVSNSTCMPTTVSCILHLALQWRHNDHDGVSMHQPHGCLLNRLFRRISKNASKLRVTGLLCGEFTVTGEFPAQRASNAENFSIWWRHHGMSTNETVSSMQMVIGDILAWYAANVLKLNDDKT